MVKSLFTSEETWNEDSEYFTKRVDEFFKDLFDECLRKGFSSNDLLTIIIELATINRTFASAKYFLEKKMKEINHE